MKEKELYAHGGQSMILYMKKKFKDGSKKTNKYESKTHMLILKQTNKERIVMYGYDHDTISSVISRLDIEGIVPVYKREWLLEQPEDFWKDLVEGSSLYTGWTFTRSTTQKRYRDYSVKGIDLLKGKGSQAFKSAKESGHSALSQVKGEYILIVREGLK